MGQEFLVFGNPLSIECTLPRQIGCGFSVDRPTREQRKIVRIYLNILPEVTMSKHGFTIADWIEKNHEVVRHENGKWWTLSLKAPDNESVNYCVVNCPIGSISEHNSTTHLEAATNLVDGRLGFVAMFRTIDIENLPQGASGVAWRLSKQPTRFFHSPHEDRGVTWPFRLTNDTLTTIEQTFACLSAVRRSHLSIAVMVDRYFELHNFTFGSEIRLVWLCTIIEGLLTRDPKDGNPEGYDSITRQICSKAELLVRTARIKIHYAPTFVAPGKVKKNWAHIYRLRSAIAHGSRMTPDPKIIREGYSPEHFLDSTVREMLRAALAEPELFASLREC